MTRPRRLALRARAVEVIILYVAGCGIFFQAVYTRLGPSDAWIVTGMLLGLCAMTVSSWSVAARTRGWRSMKAEWRGTLWETAHAHNRRIASVIEGSVSLGATVCVVISLQILDYTTWFWMFPLAGGSFWAGDAIASMFVATDLPAHPGG